MQIMAKFFNFSLLLFVSPFLTSYIDFYSKGKENSHFSAKPSGVRNKLCSLKFYKLLQSVLCLVDGGRIEKAKGMEEVLKT